MGYTSWEYIPIYIVIVIIAIGVVIACIFCRRANNMEIGVTRLGQPAAVAGVYNSRGPVLSGVHSSPASTPTYVPSPNVTPYPSFNSAHAPARPRSRAPSVTNPTVAAATPAPLAPSVPTAPPSYTEAMDSAYDPQPSAPLLEEPQPPPYESVAASHLADRTDT